MYKKVLLVVLILISVLSAVSYQNSRRYEVVSTDINFFDYEKNPEVLYERELAVENAIREKMAYMRRSYTPRY